MRLVETRLAGADDWAEVGTVVRDSWPLCDGSSVPAVLLVEVIAQSAAVLMGWKRREVETQGGAGFLVGAREVCFNRQRVAVGAELTTRVEILRSFGMFVVFGGTVRQGDEALCSAEIQAFRPKGPDNGE